MKAMSRRIGILVEFALVMAVLAPCALAQKPSAPPSPPASPPSTAGSQPTPPSLSNSQPIEPEDDYVMYLVGRVATDDGTRLPSDAMVERVCGARVRQQVYASPNGDFSMQLGSVTDTTLDASAEGSSQSVLPGKFSQTGIPRRDLVSCELRASVSGFQSPAISLVGLDPSSKSIQVGTMLVHRRAKIEGVTLDAAAYKAPRNAVMAYEKGLDAERSSKLENARKDFEKAVGIYPGYARAWFQLGTVLEEQDQKDAARSAYTKATTVDANFLQPYFSLASMAFYASNWEEVVNRTSPILARDPFKDVGGYLVDLDPVDYGEAYFFNAVANYKLSKFEDAERNAVKAERMLTRSPQLHLLLAQIFSRKEDYRSAISEIQTYLQLDPDSKDADKVRERLAQLKKLNDSPSSGKKPEPK